MRLVAKCRACGATEPGEGEDEAAALGQAEAAHVLACGGEMATYKILADPVAEIRQALGVSAEVAEDLRFQARPWATRRAVVSVDPAAVLDAALDRLAIETGRMFAEIDFRKTRDEDG